MGARYAVIAGGGSAGHVMPALAVARALVAQGLDPGQIELMGAARGQDATLLAAEPFPVTLLGGRGILRSLRPGALRANAGALAATAAACASSLQALRRWRPAVVLSVGGYAAFPAGAAAVLLGIPLVLVNPDAVPGLVNRLLGPFARESAVAFAGTPLPRATVTGTPVRDAFGASVRGPEHRAAARATLGLDADRTVVAVVGGSWGARTLNEAAEGLAHRWADRDDVALYHVTGRRNYVPVDDGAVRALEYRRVPYEERLDLLYAACDVFVCRAGANTVAELALCGVPAVFVPLPGAPGAHQAANARALVEAGAAVMVADEDLDTAGLASVLGDLLADSGHLASMARAAAALGRPGAALRVAEMAVRHGG
jgi:UDP-N-acetylglucosamine--N-acetylmuramyl-(pentapeptide) pyrophosphoryl-undecaprenol N-acetylglucosamine transferase